MMNDRDFLKHMDEFKRQAVNMKNEFRQYNFKDYIEDERDIKQLKAKVKTLYGMMENIIENRITMLQLANEAIDHRRQLINQIGRDPQTKELWDTIMMALMMTAD